MKKNCTYQLKSTSFLSNYKFTFINVFLVLTFNISNLYAQQYTLTNNDVVVENGIIINCSYNFQNKNIIIPDTLDGQTVIGIESKMTSFEGVFSRKNIVSVRLPISIKSIGKYAFADNSIAFIDLSLCQNLVFVGAYAFYNSDASISQISFPEVKYNGTNYNSWIDDKGKTYSAGIDKPSDPNISYYANFPYTLIDEDVVVSNGIILSCSKYFVYKNIVIPENLDGQVVEGIAGAYPGVFYNKGIISLKLSNRIKSIGKWAFAENNILSNTLDLSDCKSLINIGEYAFYGNDLLKNIILPGVTYNGIIYTTWTDGDWNIYSAGNIYPSDFSKFYMCNLPYTLTDADVVVENGIIQSCSYNFEIKNIIIPQKLDGQTVIGIADNYSPSSGVFFGKGIVSVEFPSSIQTIGSYAFYYNNINNTNLSNCKNLLLIGVSAFELNKLKGFELPKVTYGGKDYIIWKDGSFNNHTAVFETVTDMKSQYFIFIQYALTDADVVVEKGIITSCSYGFELKNIIIPQTLDEQTVTGIADGISNKGIFSLKGILSVQLPVTLKNIGDFAFRQNEIITLDLSGCNSLTYIGKSAFLNNSIKGFSLPEVTFNGMIYKIWNDGTGKSYTAVEDQPSDFETIFFINIPYTLTDDDVAVEDGIIKSCSYNFELKNIIIPEILDGQTIKGIAKIEPYGFGVFLNKGILSIQFPKTIQDIGDFAFSNNSLITLDLSGYPNLSRIGRSAFSYNKLTSINLINCKNLISIGYGAFEFNYSYIGYPLPEFYLPKATIPGYYYDFWFDHVGKIYSAGEKTTYVGAGYERRMPSIKDISPKFSQTSGNKLIIIIGKDFENNKNNKKVLFNGVEALNYSSWSDTLIKVVCPSNPEGVFNIDMTLENGIIYYSPKKLVYSNENIIEVKGQVSGKWLKNTTYLLSGQNIGIDDLVIEEGVKIIAYDPDYPRIWCSPGRLVVNGTKHNPVVFTSTLKKPNSWQGIQLDNTANYCSLNNCIIEYSKTGILLNAYSYGCGSGSNSTRIENCIIRANSDYGIRIGAYGANPGCTVPQGGYAKPLINSCEIYENGKAGIFCYSSSWTHGFGVNESEIYNNLIYKNNCGIILSSGSNFYCRTVNNTISNNTEEGIVISGTKFESLGALSFFANNIFALNKMGFQNSSDSTMILFNNCFWENLQNYNGKLKFKSNLVNDPLFVNQKDFNYRLLSNSPCINAGSNSYVITENDFEGKSRINWIVDIGAYEYDPKWTNSLIPQSKDFKYSIFPNPNYGQFVFMLDSQPKSNLLLRLINQTGQQIETRKLNHTFAYQTEQFDIRNLSKGIYLLIVADGKENFTEKVIVK